jgi:RNA polymerase sigma factor (sigma-70 family)
MRKRQIAREEATALVEACRDLVLRRRSRSYPSPDTEDIEQDACVRALRSQEPEKVRDPVRYLMRIARNLFIDLRRREQREAATFVALHTALDRTDSLSPERIVSSKQELQRALEAIESLPLRCRESLILHRFHNLSYPAIARRMGVSTSTVEKHIAEAMRKISRAVRTPGEQQ